MASPAPAWGQNVNWIQEVGATTGNSPTIYARGSDANVGLILTPKGGGSIVIPSGAVGIGTSSPVGLLNIQGDAAPVGGGGYGTTQLLITGASDPINKYLAIGYDTTANVDYFQGNWGGHGWATMLLNPKGGNVAIGTTSTTYKLDVAGGVARILVDATPASNSIGQIVLMGASDQNKYLSVGVDTTLNMGVIQANWGGHSWASILLNPQIGTIGNGVGIGTTATYATLDVNGYARLALNASQPVACSASNQGAIAMTHLAQVCVCDTTPAWKILNTSTACSW